MFLKKYRNSFLFGLLAGLAFPPLYLLIFLPISFYYLLNRIINIGDDGNVVNVKSLRESFLCGLVFGFGYYLTQLYWISFSLLVDIKTYFWLLPFAMMLIPLICAAYFACSILLLFCIVKKYSVKNKFLISVIFAFSYVLFEFLRAFIFPWNFFAYILGFSDILIQFASIANIYVFDFLAILFFCFGFVLFEYANRKIKFLKASRFYMIFYAAFLSFLFIFGSFRLHNTKTKKFDLKFRVVQANIKQNLKWDRKELRKNLQKYLDLTKSDGYKDVDIVIWPESSIPYILTKYSNLDDLLGDMDGKTLISGAVRAKMQNSEIEKVWNSAIVVQNNKIIDYYDKSILVPFGEYIPFSKYIPFIKKITNGGIDFSEGTGNKTIEINGIKISMIICYEVIFPNNIIDKKNRPDLIVNLTNDGWFGHSSGPYQHLVASKFRSIENKLPMIRASNSGISAYIDEYGRIVAKLNLDRSGIFDINIE